MKVGLACPECGVWTEVVETKKIRNTNILKRRRECANGHRFTTHEQVAYVNAPRKKADRLAIMESLSKSNRASPDATHQTPAARPKKANP
jgi:transcriptional regulator NrdR family protein